MQNSQLPTIERQLKVKILSGVVLLLLVGLHPVHVFADAGSSDTAGGSASSTAIVDPSNPASTTDTSSSDTSQTTTPPDASNNNSVAGGSETYSQPPADTANNQSSTDTATVSNQTTGNATTGNSLITGSTSGGNATTGNATTIATAINVLNSSTDVQSNNINTYVNSITGNSNDQNIVIDPMATSQPIDSREANRTEVNTASSGTIDNNVTVGASTGDATVSDNEVGGNATSGDATADANLINVLSSEFTSGQYYIGVVNILGDLSANILLNPDFVSQLISDNPSVLSGNSAAVNTVTQTINNAINATASSGNATVKNNLLGGNATTGNATTSVNSFNLINSSITGKNALVVFINVLGTWEGVIIGEPTGVTTAVYTSGTPSQNTNPTTPSTESSLAATTNEEINNTVNAAAVSGNANVSDNGQGGNATSGNAEVSVNLLNIMNSDISLSGWFGILFINVFGNWSGDFGIVTPPSTLSTDSSDTTTTTTVDQDSSLGTSIAREAYTIFDQSTIQTPTPGQVLGASTITSSNNSGVPRTVASTTHDARAWWLPATAGFILAAASLLLEQLIRRSRKERADTRPNH